MFEQEFGSTEPLDEDGLRAALEALEAERVDVVEARVDYWRWRGWSFLPLLWRIGKREQVVAYLVVGVAFILSGVLLRSLSDQGGMQTLAVVDILGFVLLAIALDVYQYTHFQGWIREHNARVDERIRELLERTRDESG